MKTYHLKNLGNGLEFEFIAEFFPDALQPEWGFPECEVTEDGEPFYPVREER